MAIHIGGQMEFERKLMHVADGVLEPSQPGISGLAHLSIVTTNEWFQERQRRVHVVFAYMVLCVPAV